MVKYIAIGPGFVGYFGLIGALKKLADNGRLTDLSELSGASAGAIAGFMYIATKGNFDRVLKMSLKVPLKTLMKPNLRTFLTQYGIARKHIGWYCKGLRDSHAFRQRMNTADDCKVQLQMVNDYFDEMKSHSDRLLFLEAA